LVVTETRRQLSDAAAAHAFICGSNATYTVVSERTGVRYTFKTREPQEQRNPNTPVLFISLLTGSDNESSYTYIGFLSYNRANAEYKFNAKRTNSQELTVPQRAFQYVYDHVARQRMPVGVQFWHEGRCCRCNRKLTVPSSIESGIGPECARNVERLAA
jgi:Family of unknown function (DUF6011)